MPLVERDDVVEALTPDRADHPFDERILPGRPRGGADLRQAQGGDGAPSGDIEDGVPVMQQESRRHMPRERFAESLPRPCRRGMRRDVDVQDPADDRVREDDEDEQHARGDRRLGEEIDRHQCADMVLKEGAPRLGGWPTPTGQQSRDRPLRHVQAEFEEFAVNARRAPERVGVSHPENQLPEVPVQRWASADGARAPGPVPAKPAAMPADDGSRAHDDQGRRPVWPQASRPTQNSRSGQRAAGLGRRR